MVEPVVVEVSDVFCLRLSVVVICGSDSATVVIVNLSVIIVLWSGVVSFKDDMVVCVGAISVVFSVSLETDVVLSSEAPTCVVTAAVVDTVTGVTEIFAPAVVLLGTNVVAISIECDVALSDLEGSVT